MSTQAVKEKRSFVDSFYESQEQQRNHVPVWVRELRASAIRRFDELGFPSTNEEGWKYTSVALIAKGEFEAAPSKTSSVDEAAIKPFVYSETERSRFIFVNGTYQPHLSTREALPPEVIAEDLIEAFNGEHAELLRDQLSRTRGEDHENSFTALNTAFLDGGAFIFVPKGVQVAAPIHLLFLSDGAGIQTASFPRVLIVAERESSVTVIESYASIDGSSSYLTNAVVDVHLEDNAHLVHYKVQGESDKAFHIARTRVDLHRNSVYDATTITLGAQLSRHDINLDLHMEGIECWIDGLSIVGTGQHTDTHSLINHRSPHCTSHQLYKTILDGKSRAVFNGRIYVHQAAQKTDAYQTSRSLLLSREARTDTKPQLEIFADDVKCSHGATVGQLDEEELFYFESRGLSPDTARNLLTYGFAEEVVKKIKIDSIKAQLDAIILNRLHADFEVEE